MKEMSVLSNTNKVKLILLSNESTGLLTVNEDKIGRTLNLNKNQANKVTIKNCGIQSYFASHFERLK